MRLSTVYAMAGVFLFSPLLGVAQGPTCADIKNGVFIFFSRADGSQSTYTRSGAVQKEVNPVARRTVIWDVEWVNDCSYFLKYNSGWEDKPKKELDMLEKHKFLVQILEVTADYYVFRSSLDKASNPAVLMDTLWIKQQRDAKNKLILTNPRLDSLLAFRKAAFDTAMSNSATLYVYRPGRFKEGGVSFMLYLEDKPICEMFNKAAYVVRLVKEGPTILYGRVGKQETAFTIDVKYGEKYFLRCELPWSLAPKPILTKSDREEAQAYFDRIK